MDFPRFESTARLQCVLVSGKLFMSNQWTHVRKMNPNAHWVRTFWVTLFVMIGALLFVNNASAQAQPPDVGPVQCATTNNVFISATVGQIYEFRAGSGSCADLTSSTQITWSGQGDVYEFLNENNTVVTAIAGQRLDDFTNFPDYGTFRIRFK